MKLVCPGEAAEYQGRTLTGAWIETGDAKTIMENEVCRTLTGAWIETSSPPTDNLTHISRTLTGAWIETALNAEFPDEVTVAPSRVRGLKLDRLVFCPGFAASHPHGCVD